MTIIYLNKNILAKGLLTDVLTHELGHAVAATLTDKDWKTYYKLRGIKDNTKLIEKNWNISANEDFAEVYKNIFTGLEVKTIYGGVNNETKDFILNKINILNK